MKFTFSRHQTISGRESYFLVRITFFEQSSIAEETGYREKRDGSSGVRIYEISHLYFDEALTRVASFQSNVNCLADPFTLYRHFWIIGFVALGAHSLRDPNLVRYMELEVISNCHWSRR